MTDSINATSDPNEAIELAEIKRLARQRCLEILRGDGPIRASMLGTILKLLEQTGSLEPKPEAPESILDRPLNSAALPFPRDDDDAPRAPRRKPIGCNDAGE